MPKSILMSMCEDLVDLGVKAVNWTGGGEPTLNPNLKYAIQYMGKNNIPMGMFTNGALLDKFDLFDTLVDNMTWVRFSVDAGTEKTYNWIRRPGKGQDWNKMHQNLAKLIDTNNTAGKKIDIGVGMVITPDTYSEIVDYANAFKDFDLDYCQFKPEIVNREREDGVQRDVDFWNEKVEPLLDEAKDILGDKFQLNGYKITDLGEDPKILGRHYKKCLGSQIQPCVGADGHVYVCPNQRGYKQYSYGSLHEKTFKEIWNDLQTRQDVMHQIDNVECFKFCTQLCKPHESNKMFWYLYEEHDKLKTNEEKQLFKDILSDAKEKVSGFIKHKEFI
jgi:radical SAM protein with 4Fe4S-binding SPASM domain